MKKIEEYIENLFLRALKMDELLETKQEIKRHLLETVEEIIQWSTGRLIKAAMRHISSNC